MSPEAADSIAELSPKDKEKERKRELSRIRNKRYRDAHPDRVRAKRERDADYNKAYQKEWYIKNQQKLKRKQRIYYQENREAVLEYQKEYNVKNRNAITSHNRKWVAKQKANDPDFQNRCRRASVKSFLKRRDNDPAFRLLCNMRCRLKDILKKNGLRKEDSTMELVGCSFGEFRTHIASQFEPWMNWDNYGAGDGFWVCDHIIALSRFDHGDPEDMKRAWHYSNLRPLCWRKNMEKGAD